MITSNQKSKFSTEDFVTCLVKIDAKLARGEVFTPIEENLNAKEKEYLEKAFEIVGIKGIWIEEVLNTKYITNIISDYKDRIISCDVLACINKK